MSAAIRGTEQALKLSGLLSDRPQEGSVAITKVTVVLNHGKDGTTGEAEQLPDPPHVVDGEARALPRDGTDSHA